MTDDKATQAGALHTVSFDTADTPGYQIDPPTDNQRRMAEAVLGPLTPTQRQAIFALVLYEAAQMAEAERRCEH